MKTALLLALLRRALAVLVGRGTGPACVRNTRPRIAPARRVPAAPLAAARRAWGEIRARYRLKHLTVPA